MDRVEKKQERESESARERRIRRSDKGVMRGTEYEAVQPGRARCSPLKTQAPLDSKLPVCVRTESELLHTYGKSSQKYISLTHRRR